MTKPEWGVKRKCLKCGNFFYDMKKKAFVCPKCGEKYTLESYEAAKMKQLSKMIKKTPAKTEEEPLDEEALLKMTEDVPFGDEELDGEEMEILEDTDDTGTGGPEINKIMDNFDEEDKTNR